MHARVSRVVFAIYYLVFAAFAVPGNLVTIIILSRGKCGLSSCITRYLVSMAVSDLLVVITGLILIRIRDIYFPVSLLSTTPACSAIAVLTYAARNSSVWLKVAFTFDRCVVVCCRHLKTKFCTEKTAAVVVGTVFTFSCVKIVPDYFTYEPLFVTNNVLWFCNLKSIYFASTGWAAYDWLDRILTPCVPFVLIIIFNVVTIRHILVANAARKRLRAESDGKNLSDPEMESQRKSIILLLSILGSFILFWVVYVINLVYVRVTKSQYLAGTSLTDPRSILQEGRYMLQIFSCCTNTCIYAGTQSKFRAELMNAAKSPFNLIPKMIK